MREFAQEELRPLADTFDVEKRFPTEQVANLRTVISQVPNGQSNLNPYNWKFSSNVFIYHMKVKMMGDMGLMGIEIAKKVAFDNLPNQYKI